MPFSRSRGEVSVPEQNVGCAIPLTRMTSVVRQKVANARHPSETRNVESGTCVQLLFPYHSRPTMTALIVTTRKKKKKNKKYIRTRERGWKGERERARGRKRRRERKKREREDTLHDATPTRLTARGPRRH